MRWPFIDTAPAPVLVEPEPQLSSPDPDQAWKALGLVNDWIRHAETKVAATLAASGVIGGVLFNLVKNQTHPSSALSVATVACAAFVFFAGAFAALALLPRLRLNWWKKEDPTNLLFFSHVARAYHRDGPTYVEVLQALTGDRDGTTRHIGHQIHANATVAHRKYRWANRAILAFIGALASLALVAALVALDR